MYIKEVQHQNNYQGENKRVIITSKTKTERKEARKNNGKRSRKRKRKRERKRKKRILGDVYAR